MTPELLAWLTDEERAAWTACEAATPGPWELDEEGLLVSASVHEEAWEDGPHGSYVATFPMTIDVTGDGAGPRFIVLARTALPAALRALAEARAALDAEIDARQRCRECTSGPLFGEETP